MYSLAYGMLKHACEKNINLKGTYVLGGVQLCARNIRERKTGSKFGSTEFGFTGGFIKQRQLQLLQVIRINPNSIYKDLPLVTSYLSAVWGKLMGVTKVAPMICNQHVPGDGLSVGD